MAMQGPSGVGEAIMKGIEKRFAADQGSSFDCIFRNIVIGELVNGSSLISLDEGEGREG